MREEEISMARIVPKAYQIVSPLSWEDLQEPVKPEQKFGIHPGNTWFECPICGSDVFRPDWRCPYCGQRLKWEE